MSKSTAKSTAKPMLVPVVNGKETLTPEQELAMLRAENEALRAKAAGVAKVYFKVSEKGGVSVYGMGRWPVTLYREQWERLFAHQSQLQAFITENASRLSKKPE